MNLKNYRFYRDKKNHNHNFLMNLKLHDSVSLYSVLTALTTVTFLSTSLSLFFTCKHGTRYQITIVLISKQLAQIMEKMEVMKAKLDPIWSDINALQETTKTTTSSSRNYYRNTRKKLQQHMWKNESKQKWR